MRKNCRSQVKIYCCYGTVWGTTEKVCRLACEFLKDIFLNKNIETELFITRKVDQAKLAEAEIVILASNVINDSFRFFILNCAKKNKDLLAEKITGLILVNSPFNHIDEYIDLFYKKSGFKADVSITTGGMIDVKEYRSKRGLVRCCNDARIDNYTGDFFGEISKEDLTSFALEMAGMYLKKCTGVNYGRAE